MIVRPMICSSCARYDRYDVSTDPAIPRTCSSFPQGIPDDINPGGADHRTSRDGEPPWTLLAGYDAVLKDYENEH